MPFFQKYRADKSPEKQRLFLKKHPKYKKTQSEKYAKPTFAHKSNLN